MRKILFTIRTSLFGPEDPIQLMVSYAETSAHLDLVSRRGGLQAVHYLPDDVLSCTLLMEAIGPAYARIRVFARIPSGSQLGPIIEHRITADEANLPVRAEGVVFLW